MQPKRRARWLGWASIGLFALALPLFFVPHAGDSVGDPGWAMAGVLALHPAAIAGLAAFFTHRDLPDEEQEARGIARWAFPVLLVAIGLLWLFWT